MIINFKKYQFYIILYSPAVLFFILEIFTDYVSGEPKLEYWGYTYGTPPNNILYALGLLWSSGLGFFSIVYFLYSIKSIKPELKRMQSKFVLIGISVPVISAIISETLPKLNIPFLPYKLPESTNISFVIALNLSMFIAGLYLRFEI